MGRKNPYSLVDVNEIRVDLLTEHRAGQAATLGIDVAKNELVACLVWPDRTFERPWRVKSPGEVRLLVARLIELKQRCSVVVAMESSGTYGDPLRQALSDRDIEIRRVSAKAVKDHSETFDGVPSQHDGKDAAIIGTLCLSGHARDWRWSDRPDPDQATRYWVRKLDASQRIKQIWSGKFESLLARHWPEAGRLLKQSGATLPGAMRHWGDPRALANDPQAVEQLAKFGGHYLLPQKIAQVIESARTSVGVRMTPWAVREMKEIASAILRQRRRIQACRHELKKRTRTNPTIRSQAPVVGLVTACVLWMCLGDVVGYGSAAAYRKAMGLNLKERSSGMHKGKLGLSKRGQRLTRKWLYFSALRWMREPSVKPWIERKKQRDGGRGDKAVVAVMRRLALAAWHVGQGELFEPGRLFPGAHRPAKSKENVTMN